MKRISIITLTSLFLVGCGNEQNNSGKAIYGVIEFCITYNRLIESRISEVQNARLSDRNNIYQLLELAREQQYRLTRLQQTVSDAIKRNGTNLGNTASTSRREANVKFNTALATGDYVGFQRIVKDCAVLN